LWVTLLATLAEVCGLGQSLLLTWQWLLPSLHFYHAFHTCISVLKTICDCTKNADSWESIHNFTYCLWLQFLRYATQHIVTSTGYFMRFQNTGEQGNLKNHVVGYFCHVSVIELPRMGNFPLYNVGLGR
jgi:hypothetical protein